MSLWTNRYYPLKRLPVYNEWPSILTSNSMSLVVPTEVSKSRPYISPICPLSSPFSCMQSHLVLQHLIIPNSETPNYPKLGPTPAALRWPLSVTCTMKLNCFLSQEHLPLIISQCLARALQRNTASNSIVISPSDSRNMKQTHQSRFLHCVALYLWSGILSPSDYGTTINSLHTKAVSDSKSVLSHNRVLQTASPQILLE